MKNIDPKSLIIGVLATALVFACTDSNKKNSASPSLVTEAKAATSKDDRGKWDNEQEWEVASLLNLSFAGFTKYIQMPVPNKSDTFNYYKITGGWEPYGDNNMFRKRIK